MKTKSLRQPTRRPTRNAPPLPAPRRLTVKLVKIGNSRGVRLPKAVIEQAGLGDDIELTVRAGEVVLKSARHPRAGWDAAFRKALAELGPGALERERDEWADWQNMPNKFDEKEWTW